MGFTRKYLLVNSVTGDVSKVCHQFIGSKWDTDKSSNHYGILVSSEDSRSENWIVVGRIELMYTLPKFSLERIVSV